MQTVHGLNIKFTKHQRLQTYKLCLKYLDCGQHFRADIMYNMFLASGEIIKTHNIIGFSKKEWPELDFISKQAPKRWLLMQDRELNAILLEFCSIITH